MKSNNISNLGAKMKTITIGFSRPKKANILSSTIMWFDNTDYSHVFMSFKSESLNRTLIYQANRYGVYFEGLKIFTDNNIVVKSYDIEISDESHTKLLQKCVDMSGLHYGFLQILGLGIERTLGLIGIKTKNPIQDKNYICSELIATLMKECLNIDVPEDYNEVSPHDLDVLLEAHPSSQ